MLFSDVGRHRASHSVEKGVGSCPAPPKKGEEVEVWHISAERESPSVRRGQLHKKQALCIILLGL